MDKNKEMERLFSRLEDLKKRAARGDVGISAFLSPRELYYAERFLLKSATSFLSFGGYAEAERKRIYILPDYMESISSAEELGEYGYASGIVALIAKGSGFERISHRSFMGSLLGLGVERDVIGDIVMLTEDSALVLCDESMAQFLLLHWEKVGRDKIKLSPTEMSKAFSPERRFAPISDTVASPRLDCVVAALCSLSREKARSAVENALVELDYECEQRADREVEPPCLISVRGYGKYRITSLCDKTKKGRFRLVGEKFL